MSDLDKLVTVTLDKERHLRLTLKGMLEFEKLTGQNLLKGELNLGELTLKDSAALIWACLIHEDRELTFDDFLYMFELKHIPMIMGAIIECINRALPEAKTEDSPLVEKSPPG